MAESVTSIAGLFKGASEKTAQMGMSKYMNGKIACMGLRTKIIQTRKLETKAIFEAIVIRPYEDKNGIAFGDPTYTGYRPGEEVSYLVTMSGNEYMIQDTAKVISGVLGVSASEIDEARMYNFCGFNDDGSAPSGANYMAGQTFLFLQEQRKRRVPKIDSQTGEQLTHYRHTEFSKTNRLTDLLMDLAKIDPDAANRLAENSDVKEAVANA